jgi:hypothetical protein
MRPLKLAILVAALVAQADALGAEPTDDPVARLTARQAADLAAAAFQKNGVTAMHFRAKEPEFLPKSHVWLVVYIQDTPPYVPDANMMVIVNDRTGRACVQQAMMPPQPCE